MFEPIDHPRRHFLRVAATSAAALSLGAIRPAFARPRRAGASRPAFGPVKQIQAGLLDVGYIDVGPAGGPPVVLLHGWPYDIHSFEDVAPRLAGAGHRVIVPYVRGYGTTRFLARETMRNGQQAALATDIVAFMDALGIRRAVIGGFDWGARTACVMAALWPERCRAIVSVSGYLIVNLEANQKPLPPEAERGWWYQYYFATERGRAGYAANRRAFNKLIWQVASPRWKFDEATYDRSAAAFDNPDHVDVVIHNYRWRLKLADGERRYDALDRVLAGSPAITVPAVTIGSDFDGAAADGHAHAKMFSGRHSHHVLRGIGHNVPQEAPRAFAAAIVEADRLAA